MSLTFDDNMIENEASTKHPDGATEQGDPNTANPYWDGKAQPCMVGFSCGLTIETGGYSNAKPTYSITIPADADKVEKALEYCEAWVDKKLSDMRKQIEGAAFGGSTDG